MSALEISTAVWQEMLEQARAEAPVEACGILAGVDGRTEKLYRMTNADGSSEHFAMEPAEQFAVVKDIRARGLKMLAIYHSHPETPARPSAEDIRLGLTPGVVHVIVSLAEPDRPAVRGFLIEQDKVTETPVALV